MSDRRVSDWTTENQRALSSRLAALRQRLEQHADRSAVDVVTRAREPSLPKPAAPAPETAEPDALTQLRNAFGLTPFEEEVLLLAAAPELEGSFAELCAAAQGDPQRRWPTFSLALAALSGSHWSALSGARPLRRWHLIELSEGSLLTTSPLRIDERILHFLVGVHHPDERITGVIRPAASEYGELTTSQVELAEGCAAAWRAHITTELPVLNLFGGDDASRLAVAGAVAARLGVHLWILPAHAIPAHAADLELLARLWEREAVLTGALLLVESDANPDAARERSLDAWLKTVTCPLILSAAVPVRIAERTVIPREVVSPHVAERAELLRWALGSHGTAANGTLETVAAQFRLDALTIRRVAADVIERIEAGETESIGPLVWAAARQHARARLDDLAERIEPCASWDDLVLPTQQRDVLHNLVVHVRNRHTVYQKWGFARRSTRGLGIGAMFSGPSGTGKTMAAEVIARELGLDLYRIDLSQVVSKYIGETEKNLARVFAGAEQGGAILLFDEADALFGKRSDVKDSHDRYANIEVSYLLQRIEAYRGLAILTTNLPQALDPAFARRIRFVVQFPFPDAQLRCEIWRRIFPADTPTEGLDVARLARLNVAGGNIRNIALHAAFLAADQGEPVRMSHLLASAHYECSKLERPLTPAEIGGWV
ncbi:MAG TPA: ATP-binding protein [Longimicrobiales bacterium]|nr:ATP-binding protein [Longimicrobiales bacterium]